MLENDQQLLNVQQAASFLGVKISTIRLWARTRKLKGLKVGTRGDWKFTKDELSKMIQVEDKKFSRIKEFLREHAQEIQEIATRIHIVHLGEDNVRKKFLEKNKEDSILIVYEFADNLENLKKGTIIFEKLAEKIAKKSLQDGLTLEEAVDGTIFLKQAFWQKLDEEGLLNNLTIKDFYAFSHIISTYSDIIAAKIAFAYHDYFASYEEQNKRAYARFSLAITSASVGIYEWDLQTNEIIWTPELERLYGLPLGKTSRNYAEIAKANHPDDTDKTQKAVQKAIKQKKDLDIEYRIIWPDKSIHWVSAKGKIFYDEKLKKPSRMIGVVTDITDKKFAEEERLLVLEREKEAQRKERERLYKIFMDASIPIAVLMGPDHVYELSNPFTNRVLKVQNPVGKSVKELFPDNKEIIKLLDTTYKTGKPFNVNEYPINLEMQDGGTETIYINATYQPLRDDNNKIIGIMTTGVDVTDQVLARQSLEESEHYYREMTDNTPVMTWITDPDGKCIYLNKQWYQYTGQTEKEALGNGWLEVVHPDDAKRSGEIFLEANKKQESFNLEYRLLRKDGMYRWAIDSGLPKFDDKGNFEGFVGSVVDIHERTIAEDALKAFRERQSIMLEATNLGLWYCDLPFDELIWDDRVKEHFWLPKNARVTIDTFYERIHPDDREATKKAIEYSNIHHTTYDVEYRTVSDDNQIKWIRAMGRTFYDENDRPIKFDGVTIDISDRKTLEQQKDNFLAIASHELKTPVTSIKAYGQVLESMFKKKGDLKSAGHLKKMDAQVDKLTNLIGDLLDVTKLQAGKLQLQQDYFDFNTLTTETIEELQRTTDNHTIVSKLESTQPIYGDRERIGQVLINLITNAIKYSPHTKKIIVSTKIDKEYLTLCVKDFGVGIPEDKQARVFEQFFRVSGPEKDTFPGLGLGLYLSSEIIKRENGRIWVESTEGKGSTFCFRLPLHTGQNKELKNK